MKWKLILVLAIAVILAGCGSFGASNGTLRYSGPSEATLHAGETIPGTNIKVLEVSKDGAKFDIGGQTAKKLNGDSVDWKGSISDGVEMNLHYRIVWLGKDSVKLAGTTSLNISNVTPRQENWDGKAPLRFKLPVTYFVKKGSRIPGTTLSYEGKTDKGAEIGGVEGYPYRKAADSIVWTGKLRGNVHLKLVVRVGAYTDSMLPVVGLATVGVQP